MPQPELKLYAAFAKIMPDKDALEVAKAITEYIDYEINRHNTTTHFPQRVDDTRTMMKINKRVNQVQVVAIAAISFGLGIIIREIIKAL